MIGTLTDYTQSVKEYVPVGKKKSLWEEFFTGTTSQYQTLTQQTQDVYAYDISSAYANYKQQQLQLQMNQQLGEGFKQQLSTQLQSQYGSAFSDIKSQEASALSKVNTEYLKDIAEGEEEFAKIGKQIKQLDKLVQEYEATKTTKTAPLGDIYDTTEDKYGVETKTLTEAGRLWYYKAMDENFQDWLLSDTNPSDISAEDREAIVEQLRGENAMLFKEAVGGIGSWDDIKAQEIENKLTEEKRIKEEAAAKEKVEQERESIFTNYKSIRDNSPGSLQSKEKSDYISDSVSKITKKYAPNADVTVSSRYDAQNITFISRIKINDSALTEQQKKSIREALGYYADAYIKNGVWQFDLSDNGKRAQMSYDEYIKIMQKE